MLHKDCHHDCNQSYCPFAQDTHNLNRYVCLKCGVEREINGYSRLRSFLILLLSLFIAFQLIVNYEKRHNQQQPESMFNLPQQGIE